MKKKHYMMVASALLATMSLKAQALKFDSILMGTGYANQIFYDMATDEKGSSAVSNWDIAHSTDARSSCIRANHMTGLRVISYPKNGVGGWSTFDTAGWKTWRVRYNDIHNHDKGAFSQVANHPKYDWGTYDDLTHVITGDSLYLLAWTNGASWVKFLKFWPIKQDVQSNLIFKYANVDGSNEVTDTLYQSQASKQNYKYYAFNGKAKTVREPDKSTWDITFNRYYEPTYDPGTQTYIPYPVMGVESNRGTKAVIVQGPTFNDVIMDTANVVKKHYYSLANDLTAIGSNWKFYDQPNFKYVLKDTQSYIIKSVRTDTTYWLIHFTGFGGSGTGKVVFAYRTLQNSVSVKDQQLGHISVFPNPAQHQLFVYVEESKVPNANVVLRTLTGTIVSQTSVQNVSGAGAVSIPVSMLSPGIYLLSVQSGDKQVSQKIVIE